MWPAETAFFWANSPDEITDISTTGTRSLDFCDIQGGWSGTGSNNVNVGPLFCDPGSGNFRLQDGSPCINAGNDANVPIDFTDIDDDGNSLEDLPWDLIKFSPRKFDAIAGGQFVDMGAFENPHNQACPFDLSGDGAVGLPDLSMLMVCFGGPALGSCAAADFNCSGTVDLSDISILLLHFGEMCSEGFPEGGRNGGGESEEFLAEFVEWAQQATIEELLEWNRAYLEGQGH